MTTIITLTGAGGGHGTSTIAAVFALHLAQHRPVRLITSDPEAMRSLIGPATIDNLTVSPDDTPGNAGVIVVDNSRITTTVNQPPGWLAVLRGPCYVGMKRLLNASGCPPAGIVLLVEPRRALNAYDVTQALGVPVVATLDVTPSIARTIDAGLLASRAISLPAFALIRQLANQLTLTSQTVFSERAA